MEVWDVLIIGAGPIGLACGIEAKKAGLTHLIVDKGCLTNSIYHYPLNMTFFSSSDRLEVGDVPFVSINAKPTRSEALEYYRRVTQYWNLSTRLYTEVTNVEEHTLGYQIKTTAGVFTCKSVVVATGFFGIPNTLNIEGENLPHVHHYYQDAHRYFNQKVVVVGASNSAVDVALEAYRKGAEVTMVVRGEQISDHVKYWIKPDMENRIKEGSIKAFFNSCITKITSEEVEINTPNGSIVLPANYILAMTGYKPDFSFLKSLGIIVNEDSNLTPSFNTENMESNRKNIYLAGVVCGGLATHTWFIENARKHAPIIIGDIEKKLKGTLEAEKYAKDIATNY